MEVNELIVEVEVRMEIWTVEVEGKLTKDVIEEERKEVEKLEMGI